MKTNSQIYNFAKKIIDHPRSLSGDGVRETLKDIKKILPIMKVKSFKSGNKAFDAGAGSLTPPSPSIGGIDACPWV